VRPRKGVGVGHSTDEEEREGDERPAMAAHVPPKGLNEALFGKDD